MSERDAGSVGLRMLETGREKTPPVQGTHIVSVRYHPRGFVTARCSCGWRGPEHKRVTEAEKDADAHRRGEDV